VKKSDFGSPGNDGSRHGRQTRREDAPEEDDGRRSATKRRRMADQRKVTVCDQGTKEAAEAAEAAEAEVHVPPLPGEVEARD